MRPLCGGGTRTGLEQDTGLEDQDRRAGVWGIRFLGSRSPGTEADFVYRPVESDGEGPRLPRTAARWWRLLVDVMRCGGIVRGALAYRSCTILVARRRRLYMF